MTNSTLESEVKFHHIRGNNFFFGSTPENTDVIYYNQDQFFTPNSNKEAKQILRHLRRKDFTLASKVVNGDLVIACAEVHENDSFNRSAGRNIALQRLNWYLGKVSSLMQDSTTYQKLVSSSFIYHIHDFNKNKHHVKKLFIEMYRERQSLEARARNAEMRKNWTEYH